MEKQAIDSEGGSMDRISELPQPLLHDILCLLSQKEALQTSVLSKSWRYLGSTRPKLDFHEQYFYRNKEKLTSVVDKTLQRYHDQKLFLQEFCLAFSGFDSESIPFLEKWIPIVILNMGVKTFHLSFNMGVETFINLSSSPNFGYFKLPHVFFKSETLQSLVLCGRFLIQTPIDNVILCKHLHTISLYELLIKDETLNMILWSCHLIETIVVSRCFGLRTIKLDEQMSLKYFDFESDKISHNDTSIEFNAPTLETVRIKGFAKGINLHKYLFPHLKSLYLEKVELSSSSFDSFSSNFPCLEELSIMCCYGFDKFKLSSRSIKNFKIEYDGFMMSLEAVIDAPSLVGFEYRGDDIPGSISFQATASEWKSKIAVGFDMTVDGIIASFKCLELYDILKALSKSKISLCITQNYEGNRNIEEEEEEDETYDGLFEPVVVEHLVLSLRKSQNPSSGFLKNLRSICVARKWAREETSEEETE